MFFFGFTLGIKCQGTDYLNYIVRLTSTLKFPDSVIQALAKEMYKSRFDSKDWKRGGRWRVSCTKCRTLYNMGCRGSIWLHLSWGPNSKGSSNTNLEGRVSGCCHRTGVRQKVEGRSLHAGDISILSLDFLHDFMMAILKFPFIDEGTGSFKKVTSCLPIMNFGPVVLKFHVVKPIA